MAKTDKPVESKYPFQRSNRSSNLSMGIVGLPNVGKSTFFNRLTKSSVKAENFPFCTISPTTGHLQIDDPRLDFLSGIYKPKRIIPSCLTIIDIAGLVKGASEGQGLGNQFLDNIRSVDGIFLVVRCFEDPEIIHVESSVDPIRDINIIKDELRIKDLDILIKSLPKAEKELKINPQSKTLEKNLNTLKRMIEILKTQWINEESYDNQELEYINGLNLLTTKNVVILANISADHYEKRKAGSHYKKVKEMYGDAVIPFSAAHISKDVVDNEFPKELIQSLISKGYQSLNLMNFFTCGKEEVRSWTINKGDKAPRAGCAIHSDFEKYFMSVEVMNYDEFVKNPSEAAMKSIGKFLLKGKDYVVQDGDILHFKQNGNKKK